MTIRFQNDRLSKAVVVLALVFASQDVIAQTPSNTMGNVYGNQGIITQGQQGNNTIVQGAVPRHLNDADKAKLREGLSKDRKITIEFQSTESDAGPLAREFYAFLSAEGFSIDRPTPAMIFTPDGAPRGVTVDLNQDHPEQPVQITIGIR